MSDQRYPDGEFAKIAVQVAEKILYNIEKNDKPTREQYLKSLSEAVYALQGHHR